MTFRWLPAPEQYPHPRWSWLLQCIFDVVLARMFRVDHDVPKDLRLPPGTLVVSNHLRDSDAPLLGSILYRREGVHMHGKLPFFAMREDLFQNGALANLLSVIPWPWIRLLGLIRLNWLFGNVRCLPMRRLREFTWQDTLRELVRAGQGAARPEEVFNARGRRELTDCLGELPSRVDAIDRWQLGHMRVAYWGLRRLTRPALRSVAPGFRATVKQQLERFAELLNAGHNVYFAPEGCVSADGRFGRIRAGTWQLGRMTRKPIPVYPLSISYDTLGPGRTRAIVRHGELLRDLDGGDRRRFRENLCRAIDARRVITPSHLLAHFLCVRSTPFAAHDLVAWIDRAKVAVRDVDLELDPLFDTMTTQALVDQRLRWLRGKHLVSGRDGVWRNDWASDTPPGWLHPAAAVRYLANVLAYLAPGLAKTVPS